MIQLGIRRLHMRKKLLKLLTLLLTVSVLVSGCSMSVQDPRDYSATYYHNNNDSYKDNNDDDEDESDDELWDDENDEEEDTDDEDINYIEHWNFFNHDLDSLVGVKGYYMSNDDWAKLLTELSDTDKESILQSIDINLENQDSDPKESGGSCYGMSAIAALVDRKALPLEELEKRSDVNIEDSKHYLVDIQLNKSIFSAINFYHIQQFLTPIQNAMIDFQVNYSETEQIEILAENASEGIPFLIAFFYRNEEIEDEAKDVLSGHAIIGYDLEDGDFLVSTPSGTVQYDHRVLTYDCSNLFNKYGDSNLYFNDDGDWCIPARNIRSTGTDISSPYDTNNNARLAIVMSNDDYLNMIDIASGSASEEYGTNGNAAIMAELKLTANKSYYIKSSSGSVSVNNGVITESTYTEKIITEVPFDGEHTNETLFVYIPQNEKYYEVKTEENLDFAIYVGNSYIVAKADSPGEFKLNSSGNIEITCDKTPTNCSVEITTNGDNPYGIDGCNKVKINQSNSSNMIITPSLKGIQLDGDSLNDVTIEGTVNSNTIKQNISSVEDSILINTKSDEIIISEDKNNDGKYETNISEVKIPKETIKVELKNKTVTYNGKTQNIGKAVISGTTNNKVGYLYYSDKACTKRISSHKDVGVYYVKAYLINDNGTYIESPIAKLTIKKAAAGVKLKKSSFNLKATVLKKTSSKIELTSITKGGKVTYAKVSGNSKIKVSSDGKVTVGKGLKKGTYKIKLNVNVGATKNYKKTTKAITIKIIVK